MTEKSYAADDPMVASAASNLADYYQAVGKFEKAEPLYQRIFANAEKRTPDGNSEDFRQARDRYACLLHKIGDEDKARDVQTRALLPDAKSPPATGSVIKGKAISIPQPLYPQEAKRARVSGRVSVQVVVDEKGKVTRACAIKGSALLMRAAELAAYQAVFTASQLDGQPVKVTGIIEYNFVAR